MSVTRSYKRKMKVTPTTPPQHQETQLELLSLTGIIYRPRHDEDNDRMCIYIYIYDLELASPSFMTLSKSLTSQPRFLTLQAGTALPLSELKESKTAYETPEPRATTTTAHVLRNEFILLLLSFLRQRVQTV